MTMFRYLLLALLFAQISCSPFTSDPVPGPDKQSVGTFAGAALGAGSGAVTGAQVGAGAGPGAWVGAAFGAVYGMFKGLGVDLLEEDQIRRLIEEQHLRELALAQRMLAEHYSRRLELHPGRDIFPADWFFEDDSSMLKPEAKILARELGALTKQRMPWSRIAVISYVSVKDKESSYADFLTKKRAAEIAVEFINAGVEPRRLLAQGAILDQTVLIDPYDARDRYRQAIEIVAVDR